MEKSVDEIACVTDGQIGVFISLFSVDSFTEQ